MNDEDKTDPVVPLVDLLGESKEKRREIHQEPGTPITEDVVLAPGVFRRFALWVLGQR